MELHELGLSVRAFNAVCRAEIKSVPELYNMYQCDSEKLRLLIGNKNFEEVGDALAKHREAVWEENRKADESAAAPNPAVIVSESYTRAVSLTRAIIANAQAAQQSLYEVCKGLKEMRDGKLYKELGYQNFADFCENETGIKISQAKKYVAIADRMTDETASRLANLSTEKLYMLAMLDEPTRQEITEAVDIEAVTVKDLKAQIAALTQERDENEHAAALLSEELDSAKESLASKDKQFQAALDAKDAQLKAVRESGEQSLSDCKAYLNGRIHELENRICEMENAPIDHEMTDADTAAEIAHLRKELEDAAIEKALLEKAAESKARKAADAVRHELTQMHETELQTLREGYEKQLAETGAEPSEEALDEARFNSFRLVFEELVDELENLLETMHDDPRIGFINRLDNYWTDNLLYLKREGEGAGA
ncbi:MAG: hypothetical protein II916_08630 [Oscillospiraceae bacterium]|nr:hypothetical protein [Oscillospiraceae bacterium]